MTQSPLIFLLCCLSFFVAPAQNMQSGIPPISNFSKHDYQAETQNWAATEDERGLMYFGNNLGLLEFDGNQWRCFRMPNRSILRSVSLDSLGRIFVGGQDELGYFSADQQGSLIYHSLLEYLPEKWQNCEDVWKVITTPERVFFGTQKALFLWQNNAFTVLPAASRFENYFYESGEIIVQDAELGLLQLKGDSLSAMTAAPFLSGERIAALIALHQDTWIVATNQSGIYRLENGQWTTWNPSINAYVKRNRIYCGIRLRNGHIAMGTSQNGLLVLDQNGAPVKVISRQYGLQNNSILSIFEDKSENLWLGLENGISYVEISSPFSHINRNLGVEGTAYAARIFEGKLFLATNQGIFVSNWDEP
ncbi:MAG: two-component regulator propeller domain-containing protein, partial [Bacteroidota bacterium]